MSKQLPASPKRQDPPITYVIAADIDGTLAHPSTLPKEDDPIVKLLRALAALGIRVVPCSGKSCSYMRPFAELIGANDDGSSLQPTQGTEDKYPVLIIAENGAVWQTGNPVQGNPVQSKGKWEWKWEPPQPCFRACGIEDLRRLRALLGLGPKDEGVVTIELGGETGQVAVEEDKIGVLTLFTEYEGKGVAQRWTFDTRWKRQHVYRKLWQLIGQHRLQLHVIEPHGDGAVDVVRLRPKEGDELLSQPIDKSVLLEVLGDAGVHTKPKPEMVCMLGDGSNDLPAMTRGVRGVTFDGCDKVIKELKKRNEEEGKRDFHVITKRPAPDDGGPFEGIWRLAQTGFFGKPGDGSLASKVMNAVKEAYGKEGEGFVKRLEDEEKARQEKPADEQRRQSTQ